MARDPDIRVFREGQRGRRRQPSPKPAPAPPSPFRRRREREAALQEARARTVCAEENRTGAPERRQHGEVDSGGAVAPVERLHRDGLIDSRARDACVRWQRDYLVGIERVREPAAGGGGEADGREIGSLVAARRWRMACEALGSVRTAVLTWLVLQERSWTWMAGRLSSRDGRACDWQMARLVARLCAADLAAWYEGRKIDS